MVATAPQGAPIQTKATRRAGKLGGMEGGGVGDFGPITGGVREGGGGAAQRLRRGWGENGAKEGRGVTKG